MTLTFVAYGKAEPQGSARGFVLPAKADRKARAIVTSDNPKNKDWRRDVGFAALSARPRGFKPLETPVRLEARFYLPRPQRLKGDAEAHVTRPDLDKLVRSICDAMTGIAWLDDGQVTELVVSKRFAEAGGGLARVEVTVRPAEPSV